LAVLYKITGGTNVDYLSDAEITLNAVLNTDTVFTKDGILREPICDPAPRCNKDETNGPDRMVFKVCFDSIQTTQLIDNCQGLFMKHLMVRLRRK
jgi:hypothetical protein